MGNSQNIETSVGIQNIERNHEYVRVTDAPKIGAAEDWFNPDFWQQQGGINGQSSGRNTVWFVTDGARDFVLRHYYRGGIPSRIIRDQFFYSGIERTRSIAEFNLLMRLAALGLPAPAPVAAKVCQVGLLYRADILIERIANSADLFTVLKTAAVSAEIWQEIGAVIAQFQLAGVQHSDLNCHNILLQQDGNHEFTKVWLIDFDRCDIRSPGAWQERNLKRLKRSLQKERSKHGQFFWQEADWQALLRGYNHHAREHQG